MKQQTLSRVWHKRALEDYLHPAVEKFVFNAKIDVLITLPKFEKCPDNRRFLLFNAIKKALNTALS